MSAASNRSGSGSIRTIQSQIKTLGHAFVPVSSNNVRHRNARWYRDVAELKRQQPFCVECLKSGVETVAAETDHIVPLIRGGSNEMRNLQRLCVACHQAKTQREEFERLGLSPSV